GDDGLQTVIPRFSYPIISSIHAVPVAEPPSLHRDPPPPIPAPLPPCPQCRSPSLRNRRQKDLSQIFSPVVPACLDIPDEGDDIPDLTPVFPYGELPQNGAQSSLLYHLSVSILLQISIHASKLHPTVVMSDDLLGRLSLFGHKVGPPLTNSHSMTVSFCLHCDYTL